MKTGKKISSTSFLFADAMLLLAVVGWAVSFPIASMAMKGTPIHGVPGLQNPGTDWSNYRFFFLAGRFWLAFAFFAPFVIRRSSWKELWSHTKPAVCIGITLLASFACQYRALSLKPSGEVAFLTALTSVFVPVGLWIAFKKRVAATTWLGLVVATIGAVLIEIQFGKTISLDAAAALAVLAAIGFAADLILIDYFMKQKKDDQTIKYKKLPFLTMQFLVLAATSTFLSFATEIHAWRMPAWSNQAAFGMVFMSIVATAGAFLIQTKYQPMTRPDRAALVFTLESPLAALFGYLMLAEALTLQMFVGAAMIVLSVAAIEFFAAREPVAESA